MWAANGRIPLRRGVEREGRGHQEGRSGAWDGEREREKREGGRKNKSYVERRIKRGEKRG